VSMRDFPVRAQEGPGEPVEPGSFAHGMGVEG
jgi:hypothetical protein